MGDLAACGWVRFTSGHCSPWAAVMRRASASRIMLRWCQVASRRTLRAKQLSSKNCSLSAELVLIHRKVRCRLNVVACHPTLISNVEPAITDYWMSPAWEALIRNREAPFLSIGLRAHVSEAYKTIIT